MKKIFNIAKLSFASGVHLGSGAGEEYDRSMRILHSDTISAALCSNWARVVYYGVDIAHEKRGALDIYAVLTSAFKERPGSVSNYIDSPKENGNQSFHVKLLSEQGTWEEIHISSERMVRNSRIGCSAERTETNVAQWMEKFKEVANNKDVGGFMRSFRVSSAIPIYNNRVFLPLPLDKSCITLAEHPDGSQHKRIKRLQWIEQPLWEKLSCEGKIEISVSMISGCGTAIALEDAKDIYIQKQVLEQKVAVVEGDDNEPYYFDRIFFGKGIKLGVLYESSRMQDFEQTFTLLADSGVGTRRTVGNGLFSTEFDTIEIDVAEEADGIQLLSLWLPKNEEWCVKTMSNSCYDIISRGGFISGSSDATQRNRIKKSVNMVVAGSVIATTALEGNIVDVRPEGFEAHPVWRDGRAFYLPFKKLYNNEM